VAPRGELRHPLPVGFVHDHDRAVVEFPDKQVQRVVTDLFAEFDRTGSMLGWSGRATMISLTEPGRTLATGWHRDHGTVHLIGDHLRDRARSHPEQPPSLRASDGDR
jgi:hypothetical protein